MVKNTNYSMELCKNRIAVAANIARIVQKIIQRIIQQSCAKTALL